jgi:hypothetical protein
MSILRKIHNAVGGALRANLNRERELDQLKILTAQVLMQTPSPALKTGNIQDAEFKVFSQNGEDGILQYLIRKADIRGVERSFVEFGVQDYSESNTRFLVMHNDWRGLIIDGSDKFIKRIKNNYYYWKHDLQAVRSFITRDNIDEIITGAGLGGEIGILSVDIDGNDYWVWEAIQSVSPVIVVAEYNALFGPDRALTVPYDPTFVRSTAHYSNLFWGASIRALTLLANRKGYALVGSNTSGNNIFFVRRDRLNGQREMTAAEAFVPSRFRESRDQSGSLTYLKDDARLREVGNCMAFDIETDRLTAMSDLLAEG